MIFRNVSFQLCSCFKFKYVLCQSTKIVETEMKQAKRRKAQKTLETDKIMIEDLSRYQLKM